MRQLILAVALFTSACNQQPTQTGQQTPAPAPARPAPEPKEPADEKEFREAALKFLAEVHATGKQLQTLPNSKDVDRAKQIANDCFIRIPDAPPKYAAIGADLNQINRTVAIEALNLRLREQVRDDVSPSVEKGKEICSRAAELKAKLVAP